MSADLMQFYNINTNNFILKDKHEDNLYIYGLIGNLPRSSRLYEDTVGGIEFTHSDLMLTNLEFMLQHQVLDTKKTKPNYRIPDYVKNGVEKLEPTVKKWTQKDSKNIYKEIYGKEDRRFEVVEENENFFNT